jgi:signal recognition particle receptor subunit alpha
VNRPDLILFVGEALVGNKAVEQLTKFNQALIDMSNQPNPRTIDGILLTKFDTIDDKVRSSFHRTTPSPDPSVQPSRARQVGAALSMVYTTSVPIVFLGTGQHYESLKTFSVQRIVAPLLKV